MSFTATQLFALSWAVSHVAAGFNLDTSGPSWDYTTKDLASTTSQACKDAYSANINCDDTLLSLVASMDPNFDPKPADFESMCTTSCSDSLSDYVKNVNSACNKSGDLAKVASGNQGIPQAPVAVVGEVFQYTYGKACAKDGSNYCYLTYPESDDWAKSDFPCSDKCAVQFFKNAHDQPGSAYWFNYFYLGNQSSYWEETFSSGYDTVVKCGDAESETSSVSVSTSTKPNVDASTSATVTSLGATTPTSTASTTAASTIISGTESISPTAASTSGTVVGMAATSAATGGAARVRPFAGFF